MSEELGYIRVVNVRGDEDFCPIPSEKLVMVDRSNKVLGNRHDMKAPSRPERDRAIEAHKADRQADIARKGPIYQTMQAIAFDIVDWGDKVALQCF